MMAKQIFNKLAQANLCKIEQEERYREVYAIYKEEKEKLDWIKNQLKPLEEEAESTLRGMGLKSVNTTDNEFTISLSATKVKVLCPKDKAKEQEILGAYKASLTIKDVPKSWMIATFGKDIEKNEDLYQKEERLHLKVTSNKL